MKKLVKLFKKRPRLSFLISGGLVLLVILYITPVSAEQAGLPDFTKETVTKISFGGNQPTISTEDACFTDVELAEVQAAIPRLQNALEDTTFYRRLFLLSPLCWFSGTEIWMEIETETGTYRIGCEQNRGFVEINGVRSYYRHQEERDRWKKQRAFWDEFFQLDYYFSEVNSAYHRALDS